MPKKAVIYARFSSDKQTEESIEAQTRACREYAATHDLQVMEVYADEAISGAGSKTASRIQYQRMLRSAAQGEFETILIHKYDRVARNLGEHVNLEAKLKSYNVELVAIAQNFGSTSEAKIMRALVWSMSEYYIDNLAAETRKGLKEIALKALHAGGCAPFGYDVIKQQYVVNDLEATFVRKIFAAAQACEGFSAVIAEMEMLGIKGKRGKPIKYTQIYEMLRNEKYTGTYVYSYTEEKKRAERRSKPNAIRIENAIPAIITKEQFDEVQQIMNTRKHRGNKGDYLCRGLVYCSCGEKMHGMTSKRKGNEYRYFHCSKSCGAPVVRVEDIDAAVCAYLHTLLSPENQSKIAAALKAYQTDSGEAIKEFSKSIKRRTAEKQRQYDALMQNLTSAALPSSVVQDIGAQLEALKAEISALQQSQPEKDFTVDSINAWLDNLRANPDAKAVKLLVSRIDVKYDEETQKTAFNIQSTLKAVLCKHGCGSRI